MGALTTFAAHVITTRILRIDTKKDKNIDCNGHSIVYSEFIKIATG